MNYTKEWNQIYGPALEESFKYVYDFSDTKDINTGFFMFQVKYKPEFIRNRKQERFLKDLGK